ncbi:AAA family ATPase [Streptomyces sp. ISL-87]|nr:AAA family ATPase [Streptomyces sp. ISL-87]MBT2408624.1 AAA family ATPase [Streptomyces sp. ISL-21]MBT2608692.1 AAA family ATPase [Streptomyces sp. ISL-87]
MPIGTGHARERHADARAAVNRTKPSESPWGIVDLRGHAESDISLSYPHDAVVIVAGLPGSGKSTLLHRWSPAAAIVDPRTTRTACEALMPSWLPYAVYRPWARLRHMRWMRAEMRRTRPLLIHDCGSRAWMRRWLAHNARRAARPLHMVVIDVGPREALSGQHARRRLTSRRVFSTHQRGLARMLSGLEQDGLPTSMGLSSVVLLDRASRERATRVRFSRGPSSAAGN